VAEADARALLRDCGSFGGLDSGAAEATSLMTRHRWREGDVARLEAAAARLGVQVPSMTEVEARLRLD
jgi:hypothetical protein